MSSKSLYEIITSIQQASGSNAKKAILSQHKNSALLKEYLRVMLDPAINFYQKAIPKYGIPAPKTSASGFCTTDITYLLDKFASRKLTGNTAKQALQDWFESLPTIEDQQLARWLIERSIGSGVGDGVVLSVWPDLYFVPPYQRCSLMDEKAKERFSKLKSFYVQTKADGSFAYAVVDDEVANKLITRNGNHYPQWFADLFAEGSIQGVYVGELEVFYEGTILDRKTGNGILNSIMQGADAKDYPKYRFVMSAWDFLGGQHFKDGKCEFKYEERKYLLEYACKVSTSIKMINTWEVSSLTEAYKIYSDHTSRGLEGCVIKYPDSLWKDGTAKDIIKLKLKFQGEYRITGCYEGTGKAKGMLGGFGIASEDGELVSGVGSGFTDADRKYFWGQRDEVIGKIITVEANDIISSRGKTTKSLFLPIFIELRTDKQKADTMQQLQAQLDAAKLGE